MTLKANLRSSQLVDLNDTKYNFVDSLSNPVDQNYARQCPTGMEVIGRILKSTRSEGKSKEEAYKVAASELHKLWTFGLNIYPVKLDNVVEKIKVVYEGKKGQDGFKSLMKTGKSRRNESWKVRADIFNEKMRCGFDIHTADIQYQRQLEEKYRVKMKEEDIRLYEDNCKIKECSCEWDAVVKCQECPRRMVVSDKVDGQWKKWKERKEDEERNLETMREESKTQFEIADVSSDLEDETEVLRKQEDEEMYEPNSRVQTAQNVSSISLRSSSITDDADDVNSDLSNPPFPQVPIRFGRHTFNPSVMRAVTHIQATYKLSANDAMGVCVDLARMVFGQKWEKVADFDDGDNSCASDDDYETVEKVSDAVTSADKSSEADVQNQVTAKKRRRIQKDLTWRFPSRQTRRKWLRQGALLNLRYVAEKIIKKQPEQVITLGFDDTTKAAGERLHDVKTTHITINSAEMDKETFTTGFTPNLSHSGIDQATTLRHKLQVLAVLAGDQTSVQDIIELIDFWMSDRSADGDVVLDNLGIDEKKVLKCSAHVILAIDEAIDAVFREVESKVGRDNLGSESMGAKAFQCKNSIITLGLIAIAKCLSPSHAALSYSLYQKYKDWRVTQGLPVSNFKGFVSNRFGRIAFIASLFLEHAEDLRRYWDSSIDENSNMLVLALSAYFHNDWFELGCKVYSVFDKVIITPLCELLGIDKYGEVKNGNRTWDGV